MTFNQENREEFKALGPMLEAKLDGCWKVEPPSDPANSYFDLRIELRKPNGQALNVHLYEEGYGKVRPLRVSVSGGFWGQVEKEKFALYIPHDFDKYPKITRSWELVREDPEALARAIESRLMPGYNKLVEYVLNQLRANHDYTQRRNNLLESIGGILGVAPDLREQHDNGISHTPAIELSKAEYPGFEYGSKIEARNGYLMMHLEVYPELAARIAKTIRQHKEKITGK